MRTYVRGDLIRGPSPADMDGSRPLAAASMGGSAWGARGMPGASLSMTIKAGGSAVVAVQGLESKPARSPRGRVDGGTPQPPGASLELQAKPTQSAAPAPPLPPAPALRATPAVRRPSPLGCRSLSACDTLVVFVPMASRSYRGSRPSSHTQHALLLPDIA